MFSKTKRTSIQRGHGRIVTAKYITRDITLSLPKTLDGVVTKKLHVTYQICVFSVSFLVNPQHDFLLVNNLYAQLR